jgi:hypothetical protein
LRDSVELDSDMKHNPEFRSKLADNAILYSEEVNGLPDDEFRALIYCLSQHDQSNGDWFTLNRSMVSKSWHKRKWSGTAEKDRDRTPGALDRLAQKGFIQVEKGYRQHSTRCRLILDDPKKDGSTLDKSGTQREPDRTLNGTQREPDGYFEDSQKVPNGNPSGTQREPSYRTEQEYTPPTPSKNHPPASPVQNGNGTHATQDQEIQPQEIWDRKFHQTRKDGTEAGIWVVYPNHRKKNSDYQKAKAQWKLILPPNATHDDAKALYIEIANSLMNWINSEQWTKDDGKFVPNIVRFLKEQRFLDEPEDSTYQSNGHHH